MDYSQMTAPCGIDCFNCPAFLSNEDEDLRIRISKNLEVPPEKAICNGCRNENGTIGCLNLAEPCNVYKCIKKKNINFCFECSDFPCDHLHPYADKATQRPHNTKVFNLCLIKKMGLESWAKSKAKNVRETYFKEKFKL
jgi:hypothetical protein